MNKKKNTSTITYLRSNLPILIILVFLMLLLVSSLLKLKNRYSLNPTTPQEQAIAMEHDGTDAFYEQLKTSSGEWIDNPGSPIFDNQVAVTLPQKLVVTTSSQVLGSHIAADGSEKWIEIDLSDQRLHALEGNRKVFEFLISSGRPGYNTIQGEFRVWRKVRNQTYRGGSRERGDYYYLPNVPYSLFFYKGYAIHGAYWHNDFGIKRRSSGCVNLRIADAEQLYNWAGPAMSGNVGALNATDDNPGIKVVVHD